MQTGKDGFEDVFDKYLRFWDKRRVEGRELQTVTAAI